MSVNIKIRAIVLEDNDNVRSLISSILEKRGYQVFAYSEPGACPLYLKNGCPCPLEHSCGDIIITDIDMPNISGLDFIENLLNHGCKINNFMIMSGEWSNNQFEQAKKLGLYIFKKPFDIENFNKWLEDCEKRLDPKRQLTDWFKHKYDKNEGPI